MAKASKPDFSNTEIAFRSRTTTELRKAQLLFRSFNYKWLISGGERLVRLAFGLRLPVVQPLVRFAFFDHFCGGVTIEDSLQTVRALGRFHVRSVLDYSVEGQETEAAFAACVAETLRAIKAAAQLPQLLPFTVVKITGIGRFALLAKASTEAVLSTAETGELQRVAARLQELCAAVASAGLRLLVDAEETWIQPAIDRMVLTQMQSYNKERAVVYNTLQMYCVSRLDYLYELHQTARASGFRPGIKLVRGAYMEKERLRAQERREPSPIQPDKAATDRAFDTAVSYCLEHIATLGLFAGTHNEASVERLIEQMAAAGLVPSDERVECSQLLGMSDHLTFNLAHHGYNASKYMPYGPVQAVLPYLARRAEENSSVRRPSQSRAAASRVRVAAAWLAARHAKF